MPRWGILGTSFISHVVATAIQNNGSQIVAVAGRSEQKLQEFATKFKVPAKYTNYEDLIKDPNVDIIYVGLPNHIHHEVVIKAAPSGKPVLSEKSLTVTMEQANALKKAVVDSGSFFVEGLMYLSHPIITKFLSVLKDGRIGKITKISASYDADIASKVNKEGGGTLYDLGCYPTSLTELVITSCCNNNNNNTSNNNAFDHRKIFAVGNVNSHGNVVETTAAVKFENGVLADIHTAETYGSTTAQFIVTGEKGLIKFLSNPYLPKETGNKFAFISFDDKIPNEEFEVSTGKNAFDCQVIMVEKCFNEKLRIAPFPSPCLDTSMRIMKFLTEWEAQAKKNN